MFSCIEKSLSYPLSARLLLAASLGSLAFVFVMQFGFGLAPCVLCLWQRVPFGVVAALSLSVLLLRPHPPVAALLFALCAVACLVGMGLAIFHTGVEQHWWLGTAGCAVQPLHGGSAEDIRKSLLQTITPRCDEVVWTFLGLSMANLNIGWSLACAFFGAASAAQVLQKS